MAGEKRTVKNMRTPLICGGIVFAVAFTVFLVYGLRSVPDISVLGRIASGETDVPVTNLPGQELFVYHSPQYGEKIPVLLSEISDEMIALTIATEDSRFFTNPGFSPMAILRAVLQNLRFRQTYSGASTITQQLVKNILFPENKRFERSFSRKAMEIYLAAAVTASYDKETILTLYLNEIYYGRNATGVEKAAEVYFGKHASDLDLSEAAFIAGLPQAPNYYGNDPAAGERRQQEVLRIVERETRDGRCIQLSSGKNARQYCPDSAEIERVPGK
ncbi:MAG: transglycosylase domain-containing protein [Flexilinea sp.]|nr:transglycosylase domain-containing protein [Flexilinea sp.]